MVPLLGEYTPAIIFASVDLPAPFSPTKPIICPVEKLIDTSFTALVAPNDLEILLK